MFIFIRKNGYYASQKRLCKQPVLRGGIFIAFSKRQFEVKKSPKIQLYQYVSGWLDTGKKFSGLIKKSACLLLPLNIVLRECADCGMFAITACTICFSFFPDKVFSVYPTPIFEFANNETGMIIQNHLFLFLVFLVVSGIAKILYAYFRTEYTIKGRNYVIKIEYGDLLKQSGKKVIAFDECFTTKVGDSLGDIKSQSINGQYLSEHTDIDDQCIEELIKEAELKKLKSKSKYKNKDRYESGRVLRYNNDLLMAFVKLNEKGSGRMSRSEYLESLSVLWEEISDYCDNCDIYIPILGSDKRHDLMENRTLVKIYSI